MDKIEFINNLLERPILYKINKVEDVDLLIIGFSFGSDGDALQYMIQFEKFVQKKYKLKYQWVRLIRLHAYDDSDSVKLFKRLFDEFKNKK